MSRATKSLLPCKNRLIPDTKPGVLFTAAVDRLLFNSIIANPKSQIEKSP